jgi:hypothetical protein
LGLHRDFLLNDSDIEAAVEILLQTLHDDQNRVIGFYADLDETLSTLNQPECDIESQL